MNRTKGFVVALKDNLRSEEMEKLKAAIEWFNGVLTVETIEATSDDWIVEQRVRSELGDKIIGVIYPRLAEVKR